MTLSGELWLAEGVTSYYAPLLLKRTGLTTVRAFAQDMGSAIDTVVNSPGRSIRSAVEMSQMAPFVDRAFSGDRNNFSNTFISYYTWGSVIGLGLDLTLRDRSEGRVTLDDFMRALWEKYGRPGTRTPGYVETPYTLDNLKSVLAAVANDAAFAEDFFARYIHGREVVDFKPLLAKAGLTLRLRSAGRAWAGALQTENGQNGVRVTGDVPFASPAYGAGLERDDVIVSLGQLARGERGRDRSRADDAQAGRFAAGRLRAARRAHHVAAQARRGSDPGARACRRSGTGVVGRAEEVSGCLARLAPREHSENRRAGRRGGSSDPPGQEIDI